MDRETRHEVGEIILIVLGVATFIVLVAAGIVYLIDRPVLGLWVSASLVFLTLITGIILYFV